MLPQDVLVEQDGYRIGMISIGSARSERHSFEATRKRWDTVPVSEIQPESRLLMLMPSGRWCAILAGSLIATVQLLTVEERLTFDVASVRPADPEAGRGGGIKPLPGGEAYDAKNVSVKLMFSLMHKIPMRQITGGPGWFETALWDVKAKAAQPSSIDDLHTMFQNLLADEFQLKFHKEVKQGAVYILSVDKGGPKMKVNETPQNFDIPIRPTGPAEFAGVRVPMPYLTWFLSNILQREERPVIDRTGLTGNYDFALSFAPELPPGVDTKDLPPGMMDRPTIFNALRDQLGLKLDPQKGPVEMYVIDSAEKPPAK